MNRYLVLVSSLSMGFLFSQAEAMSKLAEYFNPSSSTDKREHKPLTNAERLERRKSTVDYWKKISRIVDKAGISKDDLVYKRTHANLARAETRLQNFAGGPTFWGKKSRPTRETRARALATRKGAEKRVKAKAADVKARTKKVSAATAKKVEPTKGPHRQSMMERLFGTAPKKA